MSTQCLLAYSHSCNPTTTMLEDFYYSEKETLHLLAMPVSSSSISLSHRQPLICFLLWWICLFWTFHVSGTMQSMVFVPDFFTGHVSKVHHVVHGLIFPQQDSNHYRDLSHIHTYITHNISLYYRDISHIHQLVGILSSQFGITMIGKFSSFCLFFSALSCTCRSLDANFPERVLCSWAGGDKSWWNNRQREGAACPPPFGKDVCLLRVDTGASPSLHR